MKVKLDDKGVALVTALMLTLISLSMIAVLMLIVTQSTSLSGANKRYRTALAASYGGVDIFAKEIVPAIFGDYSSNAAFAASRTQLATTLSSISLAAVASDGCLRQKMNSPTSAWSNCTADQSSSLLSSVKTSPDLTFNLRGTVDTQGYKVYTKIIDTSPGNTDPTGTSMMNSADKAFLTAAGSTTLAGFNGVAYKNSGGGGGSVGVQHIPIRYRIEVQGERVSNPVEKANLSILYAY